MFFFWFKRIFFRSLGKFFFGRVAKFALQVSTGLFSWEASSLRMTLPKLHSAFQAEMFLVYSKFFPARLSELHHLFPEENFMRKSFFWKTSFFYFRKLVKNFPLGWCKNPRELPELHFTCQGEISCENIRWQKRTSHFQTLDGRFCGYWRKCFDRTIKTEQYTSKGSFVKEKLLEEMKHLQYRTIGESFTSFPI